MTLPDWILEIEKRIARATPGPWDAYWETGYEDSHPVMRYSGTPPACQLEECVIPGYKVRPNDAEFIAESRTDIPRLIDSLKLSIEALEFYEDRENWDDDKFCPTIWNDGNLDLGKKARESLEKIRGES